MYRRSLLVRLAIRSFETLLRVDRDWASVSGWLVRAHTLQRREQAEFLAEKPEIVQELWAAS